MSLLPIVAITEVAFVDPTSHNLLPFEFVVYAFGALPGFLGAWLARKASGTL
jgi:hypothetical protein